MKELAGIVVVAVMCLLSNNLNAQNQILSKSSFTPGLFTHLQHQTITEDTKNWESAFQLKNLDFYCYGNLGKKTNWLFAGYYKNYMFNFLELFVNHHVSDFLNVKAGNFGVPGMRSGANIDSMYTTTNLKFVGRPGLSGLWAEQNNLKNSRNIGVQFHGKPTTKLYYAFMISNYYGDMQDVIINNSSKIKTNIAYWGKLEYLIMPHIRFGVHANTGEGIIDTVSSKRQCYGAYFLIRNKKMYFLSEYIKGSKDQLNNTSFQGFFVEGAYNFNKMEIACRYNHYKLDCPSRESLNTSYSEDYTFGLNYYFHEKNKIQLNYIYNTLHEGDQFPSINHKIIINLQIILI